jgi:hypothetical protein
VVTVGGQCESIAGQALDDDIGVLGCDGLRAFGEGERDRVVADVADEGARHVSHVIPVRRRGEVSVVVVHSVVGVEDSVGAEGNVAAATSWHCHAGRTVPDFGDLPPVPDNGAELRLRRVLGGMDGMLAARASRDGRAQHEQRDTRAGEPTTLFGVSEGTRTLDPLDHNQMLYQLSYAHHA